MKVKMFLLTLGFIAFSSFAFAQTATPGVTKSQIQQTKRIKQGLRSGELTRVEAKKLTQQQARIHVAKKQAKRDGFVSPREKARLNHMQNKASRKIYVQKHDRQSRY